MMHQLLTAVIPSFALACFAGLGTTAYGIGGYVSPGEHFAQQERMVAKVSAEQTADAAALGCTVEGKDGFGGFAVRNYVDMDDALNPKYFGSRHGVDNGDALSVYRVTFDEGYALAKAGTVVVVAGCARA